MITCPKCGKDNQDHYKFCLGCGAELPRETGPKPFSLNTPGGGLKSAALAAAQPRAVPDPFAPHAVPPAYGPPPVQAPQVAPLVMGGFGPAPAAAPAAASGTVNCPQCAHVNAPNNMFCGSCGYRLGNAAAPVRPPSAAPPELAPAGNVILTALRADGSEAGTYNLPPGTQTIGRETGNIFAGDSYLSPRHATLRSGGPGKLLVRDEASLNGVYKKLLRDVPVELKPNEVFRIGQEIVRFEPLVQQPPSPDGVERLGSPAKGYIGRIALMIGRDDSGNAFPIPEGGINLGRERGDILFPEDGYVSGLHCRLSWENGRLLLTDLGSSNGTFVRIKEETEVRSGDVLLMGQQLFRVTM